MAAKHTAIERDRRRLTWLVVASALITTSVVLRWPAFSVAIFEPDSSAALLVLSLVSAAASFLWFRQRPFKSKILMFVLPALWPIADEAVAILIRFVQAQERVELLDMAATTFGVCLGWYLCWSLRPYEGLADSIARRHWKYVRQRALRDREFRRRYIRRAKRQALILLPVAAAQALIVLWILWYSAEGQITLQPFHVAAYVWLILAMFLIVVVVLPFWIGRVWLVYEASPHYSEQMPCFSCDTSCSGIEFDENGWGCCSQCQAIVHRGQWIPPSKERKGGRQAPIKLRTQLLHLMPAILLTSAAMFLVVAAGLVNSNAATYGVMATLMVVLMHGGIRSGWIEFARICARQHIECRECAYDLEGASIEQGVGVCPECGTRFARMVEEERPKAQ